MVHTTMKTIFRVAMGPNTISYRSYKHRIPKRCLSNIEVNLRTKFPVKMLLQDLIRKGPFFLHPFKILQDLARSCEIFRDFAGFFRNLAGILYKTPARFLQNPARSRMILQDLEGMQEKRTFSCKILLEHFYWEGTTVATRLWHFVQGVHNLVEL